MANEVTITEETAAAVRQIEEFLDAQPDADACLLVPELKEIRTFLVNRTAELYRQELELEKAWTQWRELVAAYSRGQSERVQ